MMKFGLSEENFSILNSEVIEPLKALGGKVWIFGSRARGDQREFSDIDVLFEGQIRDGDLGLIKERIEESRIPYKVDIVEVGNLAESYREQVLRERLAV